MTRLTVKQLKQQLQVEVDAAYIYQILSEHYEDPLMKEVLQKLSSIENHHAQKCMHFIREKKGVTTMPPPSRRARFQVFLARYIGYDFLLSNMAGLESRVSQTILHKKQQSGETVTGLENVHFNILQEISQKSPTALEGDTVSKIEGKHRYVGGNVLRASVLGANDGLVSNLSLVMGVVGASNNVDNVIIAGVAGLLAGSISMAMGEWLSVQSARELYLKQVAIEAEELETSPEEEKNELILLYQAKGIKEEDARKIADDIFSNTEVALQTLLKEELGLDKESLNSSPMHAALASFCLFALGASIPLLPYLIFDHGYVPFVSIGFSAIALFVLGAAITLFTGISVVYSGLRQVVFGLIAAAITYGIGHLIGVTLL